MSDEGTNGHRRPPRSNGSAPVLAPWARALRETGGANRTVPDGAPLAGLKRFMEREQAPKPRPGERCEMCGEPIPDEHSHVVNVQTRGLMCTCRGCYLLFTHDGAAQGRYRAVPDRYLYDPAFKLGDAQWESLQIPVSMAFFFVNSTLDRFVAFYPSPAGATESLLPLDTWGEVLEANPAFAGITPDVEALLLNRLARGASGGFDIGRRGPSVETPGHTESGTEVAGDADEASPRLSAMEPSNLGETECFLAPIADCYELVGRVRLHWRGFAGGDVAWREIAAFFDGLRAKSRVVGAGA